MSQLNIYVSVPPYLDDWLRHEYWNEDNKRVEFPRGSAPRAVLHALLVNPPKSLFSACQAKAGDLPIEVPTFKGLNPYCKCYLHDKGKKALVSCLKKLFQSVMWKELSPLLEHDVQITDVIFAFLENHGIQPTPQNWETVRQMFFRMRKRTFRHEEHSA